DQKRAGTPATPGSQPDVLAKLETQTPRPDGAGAREPVLRRQQQQESGGPVASGRSAIDAGKQAAVGGGGGAGGLGDASYWAMRRGGEKPDALAATATA